LEQIELKRGDCSWRLPALMISVHMQLTLKKVHILWQIRSRAGITNLSTSTPKCTFACHLLKIALFIFACFSDIHQHAFNRSRAASLL